MQDQEEMCPTGDSLGEGRCCQVQRLETGVIVWETIDPYRELDELKPYWEEWGDIIAALYDMGMLPNQRGSEPVRSV